ncbi:MAG: carbohydrate kinase, partial [Dehalococcoidia bacterium]
KEMGGAPANFAYHACALGGEGVVISSIGADDYGRQIFDRLGALSLSREYVSIDGTHPTGTVEVTVDARGKPSYIIRENVAWDFIPNTPQLMELAKKADAVCFGTLAQRSAVSRATIQAFLKRTPQKVLRIFDINLRQSFYSKELIESSLDLANVLKLNDEELAVIASLLSLSGDESTLLAEIAGKHRLYMVALTRGDKGSILYSDGQISIHPGYKVEVVDTVGAGDAFTASLALSVLSGQDLDAINDHANRVAAFVCSKHGATPRLPDELRVI